MRVEVDVLVYKTIEVVIDETKFDADFIKDFKEVFYDLEDIQEHVEHLAQLKAREIVDNYSPHKDGAFIEGYGRVNLMGIKLVETSEDWTIESYTVINDT